jgi:hypothetical protein
MLECCCDPGYFVDVPEEAATSEGTLFCRECRELIPAGVEHYRIRGYAFDEFGEEYDAYLYEVCEPCTGLILALLERGFCWYRGDVRADVRALHEEETGQGWPSSNYY